MIIAGFPGVGKTTLSQRTGIEVIDNDSSKYSRGKEWPKNYVNSILASNKNRKIVLCSTHKEVLNELNELKENKDTHDIVVVSPRPELKEEYVERIKSRRNKAWVANILEDLWDEFMDDIYNCGLKVHYLKEGEYLSDVIKEVTGCSLEELN